jgi:hypothetical protein
MLQLYLLGQDQKRNDVVSKEHVNNTNADENLLKNIVTGDETWVYGYYVKTQG